MVLEARDVVASAKDKFTTSWRNMTRLWTS
jgi:hypothetical protein